MLFRKTDKRRKSPAVGRGVGRSGVVPPTLLEEDRVPKFYIEQIATCGATYANSTPNTALVRKLMLASRLPDEVLTDIWTLCSRSRPGELTRQEFYACLALIALAQKGLPLSALCEVSMLPIPFLQTYVVSSAENGEKMAVTSTSGREGCVAEAQRDKSHNSSLIEWWTKRRDEPARNDNASPSGDRGAPNLIIDFAAPTENPRDKIPPTCADKPESEAENLSIIRQCADIDFRIEADGSSLCLVNGSTRSQLNSSLLKMWHECLKGAQPLFKEFGRLITNHGDTDVREVLWETKKGSVYLESLLSIFSVIRRISASLGQVHGIEADELHDEYQASLHVWAKIIEPYRVVDDVTAQQDDTNDNSNLGNNSVPPMLDGAKCLICYQPCQVPGQLADTHSATATQLHGHVYHSQCANFYLHRVCPVLPLA